MDRTKRKRRFLFAAMLLLGIAGLSDAAEPGHTRQIETLAFSPDGQTLVSGGHDGRVIRWDVSSGDLEARLQPHRLIVSGLAFTADGEQMATASWDGTATVRPKRGTPRVFQGHRDLLHDVAITADGKRIATSSNDRTVRLWDVQSGEQLRTHQFVDPVPDGLAFSPDGKTLAVGTRMRTVVLFDVADWEPTATLSVGSPVGRLRFVNDGEHLLVGTRGVERWDLAKRQKVEQYTPKGRSRGHFDADHAGKVIAALSGRNLTVWPNGDPEQSRTLPKSEGGTAVAVSPDGKRLAMGKMSGGLVIWDTAAGEVLHEIAPGQRPAPPEGPNKPVAAMFGKNLLAPGLRDRWRMHVPTDALHWLDPEHKGGLAFTAASIPTHMVGNDVMTAATGLGNDAFDLTFDVMIQQAGGSQFFKAGLAIGMSSAPVDYMTGDDIAAVVALHLDGIIPAVTRGQPYEMYPNYGRIDTNAIARTGSGGRKKVIPWSRAAKGTFTRDLPVRIRIRRAVGPDPADDHASMQHQLVFTLWVPSAGQTEAQPWRRWTWTMPEDLRDKPLDHLFIKRIHVTGDHLGHQSTGYGQGLRITGRLAGMTLRPDPPTITSVSGRDGEAGVLNPGDKIHIRGAGFSRDSAVSIGGKTVDELERVSSNHLRVAIPDLAPGRSYDLKLEQPGTGLVDRIDRATPVGRFVTHASLIETSPDGGDVLEVFGFGFDDSTEIRIGGKPADILEVGPTTLKIRTPPGRVGAAAITATHPDANVHGSIGFAYAARPSLWFTAEALQALRERSKREPWNAYRQRIVALAETSLDKRPRTGRHAEAAAEAVIWGYILTGEKVYRDRVIDWLDHFAKERPFGEWNYRMPAAAAMGYDLVADHMDPSVKGRVQRYLMDTIDYYLEHDAHGSWFASNATSTNPMVNRGAVPAALMFADVHPDSERVIEAAKRFLLHYLNTAVSPDGAWTEGMSWASDGLREYLDVAHLLAKRRNDRTLLEQDRLATVARQYEVMIASPTELITYNNMYQSLKGAAVAAHVDAAHDAPLLRWVADASIQTLGQRNVGELGLAMTWRSDRPAPKAPELPTLARFEDVNWVTMRSHPRVDPPLLVGVKGIQNGPQPYHQHHDAGSITVYVRGEPLVLDPAWGQARADQHSLPIIEGRAPDRWGAAVTDTWSAGPWRAAVVDATDAYHGKSGALRVRRTVAMHRDGLVVVLDDIAPGTDRPGKVSWKLQTLEAERAGRRGLRILGPNAALAGKLFGPEIETSIQKRKRRFQDVFWHTVTANYNAAPDRPLIAVFEVVDQADAAEVRTEVNYGADRITVDLGKRGTLSFRGTDAGWGLVKPGGEGDEPLMLTPATLEARPRVVAVRAEERPTLDGKLDDAVWQSANPADGFKVTDSWEPDKAPRFPTEARFAWDERNLYLAIRAFEPNLDGIVSTLVGPAQSTAGDDRIEFFLDPAREHTGRRYFGYDLLASGMHLGRFGKMGDLGSAALIIREGRQTREPRAWTLEVAIPWSSLLSDPWRKLTIRRPRSGLTMSMNLQRYRMQQPQETSMWSRSEPSLAATPWRWGLLVLE